MIRSTASRHRLGGAVVIAMAGVWTVLAGCGGNGDTSSSGGSDGGQPEGSSEAGGGSSSGSSGGSSGSSGGPSSGGSSGTSSGSSGSPDGGSTGAPVPFQALSTYYISPTGDDSKAGTSPSTAWATPNHALNCGDVIIAAPGAYDNNQFGANNWGAVSKCPSTTGGIDGDGGIYFAVLLCGGPDLTSCTVDGGTQEAIRVDSSNWAVEGFAGTQAATASEGGFAVACYAATSETSTTLHHVAFINDIASGCDAAGFDSYSFTGPGGGVDQFALVGAIAYDAAPSQGGGGICGSGISIIPVNGPDTSAGTHVFVAGAFSYKNVNAPVGAGCNTDGEGLIFDSWGVQPFKYQAVAEQNVFWANGGPGFEAFPQGNFTSDDQATIVVFGNTSYGNYQDPLHVGSGDLFLNQVYPTTGSYSFKDNIFEATQGSSASGTVYGAAIDCTNGCPESVLSIDGNCIWNSHLPTTAKAGGANTQAYFSGKDQGASFPWGTNTFDDPGLARPGDLPSSAPNCTGAENTTACMIGAGVPASVAPSGAAAGKGYEPPGPCAADAYYPAWLKGVVYLKANGSTLTENGGLITKPCGT
jgi:hypothetical protein